MTKIAPTNAAQSLKDFPAHAPLVDWLESKHFDIALASMSTSARSKKPGRVTERVGKKLKGKFKGLRVLNWSKEDKFCYALAHTRAPIRDVAALDRASSVTPPMHGAGIFQTDLYMHCREETTEGNAVTSTCLTDAAYERLAELGLKWTAALDAARIFSTGLQSACISPEEAHEFLFPFKGGVAKAQNVPIRRIEHGASVYSYILVVTEILSQAESEGRHIDRLEGLEFAMTPEGHPGNEAFAELVKRSARRIR